MNTKQQDDKLLSIFKQFDTNNDGVLSMDEIREGYKEFFGEQMMFDEELLAIIKKIDLN